MASDSPQLPQQVLPFPTSDVTPVRGVRWVLTWAAAMAVLGAAVAILLALAYQLAAEQNLAHAAAAGLREAACDRATRHSVEQTVRRRLVEHGLPARQVLIALQHNGAPVPGVIRHTAGDRLSVSLSIPAESVLPNWLNAVGLWGRSRTITASAGYAMAGL